MLFYLTQWFPRAYRSRMFGSVAFAMPVASIVGAPLSSLILQAMNGVMGLHGWQWLFLFEGLPALIMGIVVFVALPSRPEDAKWLTDAESRALLSVLTTEREARERVEQFTVWRAMTDGRVLLMCLIALGLVIGNTGTAIWMPQIIRSLGANTTETGLLTTVPSLAGVVALAFCAWNADRTGERVWHVAGPFLVAGLGFILAAYAHAPALRLLGLSTGCRRHHGGLALRLGAALYAADQHSSCRRAGADQFHPAALAALSGLRSSAGSGTPPDRSPVRCYSWLRR